MIRIRCKKEAWRKTIVCRDEKGRFVPVEAVKETLRNAQKQVKPKPKTRKVKWNIKRAIGGLSKTREKLAELQNKVAKSSDIKELNKLKGAIEKTRIKNESDLKKLFQQLVESGKQEEAKSLKLELEKTSNQLDNAVKEVNRKISEAQKAVDIAREGARATKQGGASGTAQGVNKGKGEKGRLPVKPQDDDQKYIDEFLRDSKKAQEQANAQEGRWQAEDLREQLGMSKEGSAKTKGAGKSTKGGQRGRGRSGLNNANDQARKIGKGTQSGQNLTESIGTAVRKVAKGKPITSSRIPSPQTAVNTLTEATENASRVSKKVQDLAEGVRRTKKITQRVQEKLKVQDALKKASEKAQEIAKKTDLEKLVDLLPIKSKDKEVIVDLVGKAGSKVGRGLGKVDNVLKNVPSKILKWGGKIVSHPAFQAGVEVAFAKSTAERIKNDGGGEFQTTLGVGGRIAGAAFEDYLIPRPFNILPLGETVGEFAGRGAGFVLDKTGLGQKGKELAIRGKKKAGEEINKARKAIGEKLKRK